MADHIITRDLATRPELRADGDGPARLTGYAAVFDQRTEIGGMWVEEIAPGAFRSALAADDVRALYNHNPDHVLGRTAAGTLTLCEDATGLRYEITLPDTTLARDVLANVQAGNITGSSIGFTVKREESAGRDGALPVRRITEVGWLRDVGPVTFPAYPQTTSEAEVRSVLALVSEAPDLRANDALAVQLSIDEVER